MIGGQGGSGGVLSLRNRAMIETIHPRRIRPSIAARRTGGNRS
jgi:hypothetical protein